MFRRKKIFRNYFILLQRLDSLHWAQLRRSWRITACRWAWASSPCWHRCVLYCVLLISVIRRAKRGGKERGKMSVRFDLRIKLVPRLNTQVCHRVRRQSSIALRSASNSLHFCFSDFFHSVREGSSSKDDLLTYTWKSWAQQLQSYRLCRLG